MMDLNELREELALNIHALDMEAQKQAQLAQEAAEIYAESRHAYKVSEMEYDEIKAATSLDIRKNPEEYDIPKKLTVDIVNATVSTDETVKKARMKMFNAEKNMLEAKGVQEAFNHKKTMIEHEVRMLLSGIFGEPNLNDKKTFGK